MKKEKKYVVTKKHPYYKPGLEFKIFSEEQICFIKSGYHSTVEKGRLVVWLESGLIEEVKKAKNTKKDMLLFASHCITVWNLNKYIDYEQEFKQFKASL